MDGTTIVLVSAIVVSYLLAPSPASKTVRQLPHRYSVVAVSLEKQEGIVTKRKAKEITDLILYAIHPALAEAHLITGKRAE